METPSPFPASPFSNKPRLPLTPPVELNDDSDFKKKKTNSKKAWYIGGGTAVAILLVGSIFYTNFISTRVAPGLKFAINDSGVFRAGEQASFRWQLSPDNQKKYPQERIDVCRSAILGLLTTGCAPVVLATQNDGEAEGLIPVNFHPGTAYIKLTARNPKGGLFSSLWTIRKVTILPAIAQEVTGGGSGGGNGGGGSNDGARTPGDPYGTPTPSPFDPYGSPTPSPSPMDPYGGDHCVALCSPSATGSVQVAQDCAAITSSDACAAYNSPQYPYGCQWVSASYMCPVVP